MNRTVALFHTAIGAAFWVAALAAFSILGRPLLGQQSSGPVEVQIVELEPTPAGVSITLRAVNSRESIHMMIGLAEGESIMQAMHGRETPRPMTHDLLKSVLDRNGWKIQKVLIRDLVRGTFRADLTLEKGQETQVYDARPSDAMAIGLRFGAKIFVNQEVFEQQKQYERRPETKPAGPDRLRL